MPSSPFQVDFSEIEMAEELDALELAGGDGGAGAEEEDYEDEVCSP